jgi:hypothetical protein
MHFRLGADRQLSGPADVRGAQVHTMPLDVGESEDQPFNAIHSPEERMRSRHRAEVALRPGRGADRDPGSRSEFVRQRHRDPSSSRVDIATFGASSPP